MKYLITKIFDNLGVLEVTLFHEFYNAQIRWGFLRGTGHGFFLLYHYSSSSTAFNRSWLMRASEFVTGPHWLSHWPAACNSMITSYFYYYYYYNSYILMVTSYTWFFQFIPKHIQYSMLKPEIVCNIGLNQLNVDRIKSVLNQRSFLHYVHYMCSSCSILPTRKGEQRVSWENTEKMKIITQMT